MESGGKDGNDFINGAEKELLRNLRLQQFLISSHPFLFTHVLPEKR